MSKKWSRKVFFCECNQPEHQLIVEGFDEDNYIYLSVCLADNLSFSRRICKAIQYVFGRRSKYGSGMFSEIVLSPTQAKNLARAILNDSFDPPN
jgi:hypothetical protein